MLAESLLQTHKGRSKKLICSDQCHEALVNYVKKVKEDFEMPELFIPMHDYESTGQIS